MTFRGQMCQDCTNFLIFYVCPESMHLIQDTSCDFVGLLKIVIYHGGQFLGDGDKIYSGGKVEEVEIIDPDYISVGEIGSTVKTLGYLQTGDLWYTFDDEKWLVVKTFKSDKNVTNMINRSRNENKRVLNIFVEHAIEEAELVEDIGGEGREDTGGGEDLEGDDEESEKEDWYDNGTDISNFLELRDNELNPYEDVVSLGVVGADNTSGNVD